MTHAFLKFKIKAVPLPQNKFLAWLSSIWKTCGSSIRKKVGKPGLCGESTINYSDITKGEIWWGRYNLNWGLNKLAAAEDGSVSMF